MERARTPTPAAFGRIKISRCSILSYTVYRDIIYPVPGRARGHGRGGGRGKPLSWHSAMIASVVARDSVERGSSPQRDDFGNDCEQSPSPRLDVLSLLLQRESSWVAEGPGKGPSASGRNHDGHDRVPPQLVACALYERPSLRGAGRRVEHLSGL